MKKRKTPARECSERVTDSGSVLTRPCHRRFWRSYKGRDYCAAHHPDRVERRLLKESRVRTIRSRVVHARESLRLAQSLAADALVQYVDGVSPITITNAGALRIARNEFVAACKDEHEATVAMLKAKVAENDWTLNAWDREPSRARGLSIWLANRGRKAVLSDAENTVTTADTERPNEVVRKIPKRGARGMSPSG